MKSLIISITVTMFMLSCNVSKNAIRNEEQLKTHSLSDSCALSNDKTLYYSMYYRNADSYKKSHVQLLNIYVWNKQTLRKECVQVDNFNFSYKANTPPFFVYKFSFGYNSDVYSCNGYVDVSYNKKYKIAHIENIMNMTKDKSLEIH